MIDFTLVALTALAICIHFPEKPPLPPSLSSAVERMQPWEGVKTIFT